VHRRITVAVFCVISSLLTTRAVQSAEPLRPVVEVQEPLYQYADLDNGSGPMWCSGSTCLVRIGETVYASGIEKLVDFQPLNNCRWLLFARGGNGWSREQADPRGRTREPSPLAGFPDGSLFLSANPTLAPPEATAGAARPEILRWNAGQLTTTPETLHPEWDGSPSFTEHSYRSFAADGPNHELILFQNVGYTHAEWSFRDADGKWSAGRLAWPFGAEYDRPQPIRTCYPNVALRNRAVYFCGVSDIQEPYQAWRKYKKELTGRDWDYDFRRLFFTWCEDIRTGRFHDWVEIASRDKTAGWIMPGDLWIAPDGRVHILWVERALDTRLREKFFPDARQSQSLNYAVIRNGEVVLRRTLVHAEEGGAALVASAARFHALPDSRLLVFYYVSGRAEDGTAVAENRLTQVLPAEELPPPSIRVPLDPPFTSFFTATTRGGTLPSPLLDLLGTRSGESHTIAYARVRVAAE